MTVRCAGCQRKMEYPQVLIDAQVIMRNPSCQVLCARCGMMRTIALHVCRICGREFNSFGVHMRVFHKVGTPAPEPGTESRE